MGFHYSLPILSLDVVLNYITPCSGAAVYFWLSRVEGQKRVCVTSRNCRSLNQNNLLCKLRITLVSHNTTATLGQVQQKLSYNTTSFISITSETLQVNQHNEKRSKSSAGDYFNISKTASQELHS